MYLMNFHLICLRPLARDLAPALTIIFQQYYNLCFTHSDCNTALIASPFKTELKFDQYTYQTVLLTCVGCSILEHVILSHIADHLSMNSFPINGRHECVHKLSTVTQFVNTVKEHFLRKNVWV